MVLCLGCGRTAKVVLVEFVEPTSDTLAMWMGGIEPKEEFEHEGAVKCRRCGSTDLLLEPPEDGAVPCAKCGRGELYVELEWIS